ncbi:MAG: hypothetical protein JO264_18315 [Acidisphaera sp.]|nr:hypothetical protein [Acidisphaera sp.]
MADKFGPSGSILPRQVASTRTWLTIVLLVLAFCSARFDKKLGRVQEKYELAYNSLLRRQLQIPYLERLAASNLGLATRLGLLQESDSSALTFELQKRVSRLAEHHHLALMGIFIDPAKCLPSSSFCVAWVDFRGRMEAVVSLITDARFGNLGLSVETLEVHSSNAGGLPSELLYGQMSLSASVFPGDFPR